MVAQSMGAMPAPDGYAANLEHPQDVLRTVNYVTQVLTIFFCTIFVIIRAVQKFKTLGLSFAADDYATFITWLLMMGYCVCGIFLSVYGGGYHLWEVKAEDVQPFFKSAYAATIFYAPMALFVKLTLLTIIVRLFGPYKKTIMGIYVLMGLLISYYIAALVIKIRVCWPISAYWEGHSEKCLNQGAIITADSIISLVSDLIILVLPLPLTWSLQLPTSKKLRVAGMLGVGGLATAFSAWRLDLILKHGNSPDQSIVFVKVVLSGNAEAGIGLICCCLPACAALLARAKARTGYSSHGYGRSNLSNNAPMKLSHLSSTRTVKERPFENLEAGSDQAELVTNAQGFPSSDMGLHPGIMRKVEVTHSVSYHSSIDDKSSNHSK